MGLRDVLIGVRTAEKLEPQRNRENIRKHETT
jgi:hypothetical protein